MFFYFSQVKAKGKKFLFAALVLALLTVFMNGCKMEADPDPDYPITGTSVPDGMLGTWVPDNAGGDWYKITKNGNAETIAYGFGSDEMWAGTVRSVTMFDAQTGVIIIEFTNPGWNDPDKPFSAVYYLDFIPDTSVSPNGFGDEHNTTSLQTAIDKFNMEDMWTYINPLYATTYTRE